MATRLRYQPISLPSLSTAGLQQSTRTIMDALDRAVGAVDRYNADQVNMLDNNREINTGDVLAQVANLNNLDTFQREAAALQAGAPALIDNAQLAEALTSQRSNLEQSAARNLQRRAAQNSLDAAAAETERKDNIDFALTDYEGVPASNINREEFKSTLLAAGATPTEVIAREQVVFGEVDKKAAAKAKSDEQAFDRATKLLQEQVRGEYDLAQERLRQRNNKSTNKGPIRSINDFGSVVTNFIDHARSVLGNEEGSPDTGGLNNLNELVNLASSPAFREKYKIPNSVTAYSLDRALRKVGDPTELREILNNNVVDEEKLAAAIIDDQKTNGANDEALIADAEARIAALEQELRDKLRSGASASEVEDTEEEINRVMEDLKTVAPNEEAKITLRRNDVPGSDFFRSLTGFIQ